MMKMFSRAIIETKTCQASNNADRSGPVWNHLDPSAPGIPIRRTSEKLMLE
jgi:hypothetical protein